MMDFIHANKIAVRQNISAAEAAALMHSWHVMEPGGLETRLQALQMFPHFFGSTKTIKCLHRSDAWESIRYLRIITEAVDIRNSDVSGKSSENVWVEGAPTKLLLEFMMSHVQSLTERENASLVQDQLSVMNKIPTTWTGLVATSSLYFYNILNIANDGKPVPIPLLRRLLISGQEDIELTAENMREPLEGIRTDFWFWKIFIGAISLARGQKYTDIRENSSTLSNQAKPPRWLRSLLSWYNSRIKSWSEATAITDWVQVKAVLSRIAWPSVWLADEETFAQDVWNRAIIGNEEKLD
jgi:hypothetical protein